MRELVELRLLIQVEHALGATLADAAGNLMASSRSYSPGRVATSHRACSSCSIPRPTSSSSCSIRWTP
ncbi:MAG: hypothetical protein R2851_07465 [Caldilineaceae bacterium]